MFGGIALNLTVGGVNPAAVEWMTKVEGGYGKVVWLPTFDSESQAKLSGQQRPFAPVTRDGKILPEVLAVIALAAQHDLVLEAIQCPLVRGVRRSSRLLACSPTP